MKRFFLLFTIITLGLMLPAQTQQGYVKTKGRMVDGKHVPGQGLKGATVSIKGRTTVVVNKDDGSFSFPVSEAQFRVDSVRKKGYQMVDMDAIGKTYKPSPNPLYLVMETPEQQLQDQLAAERRIRRTLTNQLHQREDEIEALKEQQKISDEEYRQALQKLYEETDQNEQLVKDMVERYSTIDYDQLSEFDQKISELILNGELVKADSMLRTKGDINQRVEQYHKHEAINAKEKEELTRRQASLKQSEVAVQMERNDLANDCYQKFQICKMRLENDSAAYYLELRARLDTTNTEWQNETATFFADYISDFELARKYYFYALNAPDNDIRTIGENYNNIGSTYHSVGDYQKALFYYKKAYDLIIKENGEDDFDIATCFNNIGILQLDLGEVEKSIKSLKKALSIYESIYGYNHPDVAMMYNNLGYIYEDIGKEDSAIWYYNKSLMIQKNTLDKYHPSIANTYLNIGAFYGYKNDTTMALNCFNNALEILNNSVGHYHPRTASVLNNMAYIYSSMGNQSKALDYYFQSLAIKKRVYGDIHQDMAISYRNIGEVYKQLSQLDLALHYDTIALNIQRVYLDEGHVDLASTYNNLGGIYNQLHQDSTALAYYNKAIFIWETTYGKKNRFMGVGYGNIGKFYAERGFYDKAIEYLNKAIEAFPDGYPDIQSLQERIKEIETLQKEDKSILKEQENEPKNEE